MRRDGIHLERQGIQNRKEDGQKNNHCIAFMSVQHKNRFENGEGELHKPVHGAPDGYLILIRTLNVRFYIDSSKQEQAQSIINRESYFKVRICRCGVKY
jgi:hypothetical protein